MYSGSRVALKLSHSVRSARNTSCSSLAVRTNIPLKVSKKQKLALNHKQAFQVQYQYMYDDELYTDMRLSFMPLEWLPRNEQGYLNLIVWFTGVAILPRQLCQTSQLSAELPVKKQQENSSTCYWQPVLDCFIFLTMAFIMQTELENSTQNALKVLYITITKELAN